MNVSSKIQEKQIHKIWQQQELTSELKASNGDVISILNPGEYNKDNSGPDFKHARIKIGSLTFVGDVEIDMDYSDWKRHGHNINAHYNKIILHLTYSNRQNQNYVYTNDGRKVISIPLRSKISGDNLKFDLTLGGNKVKSKDHSLKCSSEIDSVNEDIRKNFILQLGINRFKNKRDRIYRRLKELKFISDLKLKEPVIRYELTEEFNNKKFSHADFNDKHIWKQLFYELIFEALGYSKNKNIMMKLAQNVNLKYLLRLNGQNDFTTALESIYYNISGLMPDIEDIEIAKSEYIKKLNGHWLKHSSSYDGKKFNETQWQFLGQRPQNFPTVRIAGGAKLVESILHKNLVGVVVKKFSEIHSLKVLINSIRSLFIIKANGYWRDHFVFEKRSKVKLNYIVGLSRADEIFINIILPYLSVFFDVFGDEELSKKVLKVYNIYEQRGDNKIVQNVGNSLKLSDQVKKTVYSQGMIEIYRNYCTKNKCIECDIGKHIFI